MKLKSAATCLTMLLVVALALPLFPATAASGMEGERDKGALQKNGKAPLKKTAVKKRTAKSKGAKGKNRKRKVIYRKKQLKPAVVNEMRHWTNPDYVRIVLSVDREVEVEHHQLPADLAAGLPPRIYIDLKGARLGKGVRDIPVAGGLLKVARIGQYQKDVVRVVLDIENIKDYKVFPLEDPSRVVIDVKGERPVEISRLEPVIQVPPGVAAAVPLPKPTDDARPAADFKPAKIRRIVVDPGHGGKDSGALGPGGVMEKDVALKVALKLAKKLHDELGIDVVMTRSTDIFIPLDERTAIANKVNADLFVSIHANASLNKSTEGMETYYLNLAKTDKAAQVAARENNTSLEKVSVLQAILFDLMANYKINDSAQLAAEVQQELFKRVGREYRSVRSNGVKQGPFYVLVGATMPSILVETAFISNEQEEKRLADAKYQDATAAGILNGIKAYIAALK